MAGHTKYVIAAVLLVAAVVYLIISSTGSQAHYFATIDELRAQGNKAVGRKMTVSGAILGDSIRYDASIPQVTFTIVEVPGDLKEIERAGGLAKVLHDAVANPSASRLVIVYRDVKPDLLRGEAQAIIRGQLKEDGRFYADQVLLKCPSRYKEALPGQAGGA